ncbi:MAG: hypothetical protein JWR32_563 [Mycobacterium sp.]|nr:hypothetical protein [Mycobacterium sp.]
MQDNAITAVVGVGDLKDVAGIDVEPADRANGVVAAHDTEACAVAVVPAVRHAALTEQCDVAVGVVGAERVLEAFGAQPAVAIPRRRGSLCPLDEHSSYDRSGVTLS